MTTSSLSSVSSTSPTLPALLTIGGEPQAGAAGSYPVHNPASAREISQKIKRRRLYYHF